MIKIYKITKQIIFCMLLVEQHIITKNHPQWKIIDNLCFLSKNLYNAALYHVKQNFLETGKIKRYMDLETSFRDMNQPDFFALSTNSSQQILQVFDRNIKGYFTLLKKWKKDKKALSGCPKFPRYKDKSKGRNVFILTINQAKLKNGMLHFPKKTGLQPLKTLQNSFQQVRFVPRGACYLMQVVYRKQENELVTNDKILSIDLGVNNLATCVSNINLPFIISGKSLKSVNQYYNKKKAKIQSDLKKKENKHRSRKLEKLTMKRNNKIKDYTHKASRTVVNYCIKNKITTLIIGKNVGWKTNVNMGKQNNQNFVQIPHSLFVDQLDYKCKLEGMSVVINEESYTSKCSALDLENIGKNEFYVGRRTKRGMFISADGIKINADLNGAINILRKVNPDKGREIVQTLRTRGQVAWPSKMKIVEN